MRPGGVFMGCRVGGKTLGLTSIDVDHIDLRLSFCGGVKTQALAIRRPTRIKGHTG
jgi:hypothetical protein